MDEIKNISALSFTGGNNRPGPFAPSHAGPAAGALGDAAVDDDKSDGLFAEIVGGANAFVFQKQKVAFIAAVNKSFFDIIGFIMIGWPTNLLQK